MHKDQRHMKTKGMQTYSWGPITWLLSRGRFGVDGSGSEPALRRGDHSGWCILATSQGFGAKKIENSIFFADAATCRYRLRSVKVVDAFARPSCDAPPAAAAPQWRSGPLGCPGPGPGRGGAGGGRNPGRSCDFITSEHRRERHVIIGIIVLSPTR